MGETQASIRRDMLISPGSWYNHFIHKADPKLSELFARALAAGADARADDIIDIADTDPDPQRARNRIDARKWNAAKARPEKYGERIDLNVNQKLDIKGARTAALDRLRPIIDRGAADVVETLADKAESESNTTDIESGDPASIFD